jgi:hypothetical protein
MASPLMGLYLVIGSWYFSSTFGVQRSTFGVQRIHYAPVNCRG